MNHSYCTGRGAALGRGLGVVLGLGVGEGLGVIVAVAVGVAVGVGVGVGLGVGVGVPLPAGTWIATGIGDPVLKKPTVAFASCGGWSASNRKLYNVPHRIALAFWFCANVSLFQVMESLACVTVHGWLL